MRYGALLALALTACAQEIRRMPTEQPLTQRVVAAAVAEHGWKPDEVSVEEVPELRAGGCAVYTAANTRRKLDFLGNYAVLPGGQVVSRAGGAALSALLDACGATAPVQWWADVVTRFHPQLGNGLVLRDAQHKPQATAKATAGGQPFVAPTLTPEGQGKALRFLMLEPESFRVFEVRVGWAPGRPLEFSRTQR